jgi:hypothetical protein
MKYSSALAGLALLGVELAQVVVDLGEVGPRGERLLVLEPRFGHRAAGRGGRGARS